MDSNKKTFTPPPPPPVAQGSSSSYDVRAKSLNRTIIILITLCCLFATTSVFLLNAKDSLSTSHKTPTHNEELLATRFVKNKDAKVYDSYSATNSIANLSEYEPVLIEPDKKHQDFVYEVYHKGWIRQIDLHEPHDPDLISYQEQLRSTLLAKAMSRLRKEEDRVEGITFYHSRLTPENLTKGAYLYFGKKEDQVWLRLKIIYQGASWIFFDSIKVRAGDVTFTIEPSLKEKSTHVSNANLVYEMSDTSVKSRDILDIIRMMEADEVLIKFSGNYSDTFILKKSEQQAMKEVFEAYNLHSSSLESIAIDAFKKGLICTEASLKAIENSSQKEESDKTSSPLQISKKSQSSASNNRPQLKSQAFESYKHSLDRAVGSRWLPNSSKNEKVRNERGGINAMLFINPSGTLDWEKTTFSGVSDNSESLKVLKKSIKEAGKFMPFSDELKKDYPHGAGFDLTFYLF